MPVPAALLPTPRSDAIEDRFMYGPLQQGAFLLYPNLYSVQLTNLSNKPERILTNKTINQNRQFAVLALSLLEPESQAFRLSAGT